VLSAGRGERLRPLTDVLPKPLMPVLGVAVVERTLRLLAAAGVECTAVNLHHLGAAIRDGLGAGIGGMSLTYSNEEMLLGTLGPFGRLQEFFDGVDPILLVNGDSLCRWPVAAVARVHRASGADATLLLSSRADPRHFGGGVVTDRHGRVLSFRGGAGDGATARRGVFAGLHVVSGHLLRDVAPRPSDIVRELYEPILERGGLIHGVFTRRHWHDLGLPSRYLRAVLSQARRPHRGSRIGRSWQAPDVSVASSAKIRAVVLESGAQVESDARIESSLLLAGARVSSRADITRSILGPGVEVGAGRRIERQLVTRYRPDASLRPVDTIEGDLVFTPLDGEVR
jgi:NDP-sugar pyrophosphorylase family protein